MPSHTSRPKVATSPTQRRGQQRVALILDTAASLFAEKGVEAATMTEIAARSNTAIGSLYRFFPAKELLADALFARYATTTLEGLDALADTASELDPLHLADALLALTLGQQTNRDAAVAIAEMRDDGAVLRAEFRKAIRERLKIVLSAGGVPPERAENAAPIVLQVLKALPSLLREGLSETSARSELGAMIGLYLHAARLETSTT